jgi:hypothetical protein
VHAWYGRVELWNSTVIGNVATRRGGGLHLLYPTTVGLRNATITRNFASAQGGGISGESSPQLELSHSIVADNHATPGATSDADTKLNSYGYNLVGVCGAGGCSVGANASDRVGTLGTPVDPVLLSLAHHGGLTPTHLPHAASPAVDAGNASYAPSDANITACTRLDQRGEARPRGLRCDIGAVEL